jgi:predicted GNAT superfamily acetyltransferase
MERREPIGARRNIVWGGSPPSRRGTVTITMSSPHSRIQIEAVEESTSVSAAHSAIVEIRPLQTVEELRACEAIAKVVWQVDDREIVPASHLKSLQHAGGLVAGMLFDGRLVGFVIGFLARHEVSEEVGLHSHLMGVLPDYRGSGVARELKWFQRRWCLERSLRWITWTFDPLQGASARLNLETLGAEGVGYTRDFYGTLGGVLYGSLPTDRLLTRWELESPRVVRLAAGVTPEPADDNDVSWALTRTAGDGPGTLDLDLEAASVRVATPGALAPLLYRDPELASDWRHAVRVALEAYLESGYRAKRFAEGAFQLERHNGNSNLSK